MRCSEGIFPAAARAGMMPTMNIHRFDHKVKTEAPRVQRVDLITGVECRRDWTDELPRSAALRQMVSANARPALRRVAIFWLF
jgi:hypothetical protein